ncbi:uncharacterized protein FA14DRAFT_28161 [Meira miltonrushii]|uniref:Uncharacterized protein n=1 Tax=Meira miltonrushii TaxID=1280837 RepID=A0A316VLT8_9BASI|nr:uncharacterized protein FA14DRAFT_28161 [Meira miltonrushii]PWN38589.1 hypothetical protein FA14DRAFT_28161 [Meira miltonrushii]
MPLIEPFSILISIFISFSSNTVFLGNSKVRLQLFHLCMQTGHIRVFVPIHSLTSYTTSCIILLNSSLYHTASFASVSFE